MSEGDWCRQIWALTLLPSFLLTRPLCSPVSKKFDITRRQRHTLDLLTSRRPRDRAVVIEPAEKRRHPQSQPTRKSEADKRAARTLVKSSKPQVEIPMSDCNFAAFDFLPMDQRTQARGYRGYRKLQGRDKEEQEQSKLEWWTGNRWTVQTRTV